MDLGKLIRKSMDENEMIKLFIEACNNKELGHKIVNILLEKKLNINQIIYGYTIPLPKSSLIMHALIMGHNNIFDLLYDNNADLNLPSENGATPLMVCMNIKRIDFMVKLLNKGVKIDNKTIKTEQNALHIGAEYGFLEGVKLLLEKGADIDNKTKDGSTAFYLSVKNNHPKIVKLLLEKGADIDNKTKDDFTALHIAVRDNRLDIVKLLLEKGAGIDNKTKDGFTALHIAVTNNHPKMAKLLLETGAGIDNKTTDGFTALHIAVRDNRLDIVKLLLEKGANIDMEYSSSSGLGNEDIQDKGLIFFAIEYPKILKLLLKYDVNINATLNINGNTPLHEVVVGVIESVTSESFTDKYILSMTYLLKEGSDYTITNKNGLTPLKIADNQIKELETYFHDINDTYYALQMKNIQKCKNTLHNFIISTSALDTEESSPEYHINGVRHKTHHDSKENVANKTIKKYRSSIKSKSRSRRMKKH